MSCFTNKTVFILLLTLLLVAVGPAPCDPATLNDMRQRGADVTSSLSNTKERPGNQVANEIFSGLRPLKDQS